MYEYYVPAPGYWEEEERAAQEAHARSEARHVEHAQALLERAVVGEELVFEGHCPSGSTYWGDMIWDGTDECRAQIMSLVRKYSVSPHVGWLCRERDVRGGLNAAEMRTG